MAKIPSKFNVGGQEVNVHLYDNLDGKLGECCLAGGYLKLAKTFKGIEQTPTSLLNTFYHEVTHAILDTMGRDELSSDEVFVNTFASFLTEALTSGEKNVVLFNVD